MNKTTVVSIFDFAGRLSCRPAQLLLGVRDQRPRELFEAGCRFVAGRRVTINVSRGIKLLTTAERKGDISAKVTLALSELMFPEIIHNQAPKRAMERLAAAAAAGHKTARQQFVAIAFQCGNPEQTRLAVDMVKEESKCNAAWAHYEMGVLLSEGKHIRKSLPLSAQHFRMAASCGDVDAMVNIAIMIVTGECRSLSPNEEKDLLDLAFRKGHPSAAYEIGLSLIDHRRFEWWASVSDKECEQRALMCFEEAAKRGHSLSQDRLARSLLGSAVDARRATSAANWFALSALQGEPVGCAGLSECFASGLGVRQNASEASFWRRVAMGEKKLWWIS